MNQYSNFVLLLILMFYIQLNNSHHCIHDKIMKQYGPIRSDGPQSGGSGQHRILQSSRQAIRITIDYSSLDQVQLIYPQSYAQIVSSIQRLTETSKHFYQSLLKVYGRPGNNIFSYNSCLGFNVPAEDKVKGIPNSDLHIYVTFDNEYSEDYLAYAGACSFTEGDSQYQYYGPSFGRLNYNLAKIFQNDNIKPSNLTFHHNLQIVKHEMMHILCFSQVLMEYFFLNPATGQPYSDASTQLFTETLVNNEKHVLIKSPNVLSVGRNYFNCPSLQGIQLENDGGQGSALSHWEKAILYNEIMNPQVHENMIFSPFSIALLKDSGFYQVKDDAYDILSWGRGKGCQFVQQQCMSTVNYPEFCSIQDQDSCNFESTGVGYCDQQYFFSNCMGVQTYSNTKCNDESNNDLEVNKYIYNKFGIDSKCFFSNLRSSGISVYFPFRCYQYSCQNINQNLIIVVTIGSIKLICTQPGQILQAPLGLEGNLTCPQNFNLFCQPQFCPNYCSQNGYCLGNKCICLFGMGGTSCSEQMNSQCKSNQYLNSFNMCINCDSSCLTCSGGLSSNCLSCTMNRTLSNNNTCIPAIKRGSYLTNCLLLAGLLLLTLFINI